MRMAVMITKVEKRRGKGTSGWWSPHPLTPKMVFFTLIGLESLESTKGGHMSV